MHVTADGCVMSAPRHPLPDGTKQARQMCIAEVEIAEEVANTWEAGEVEAWVGKLTHALLSAGVEPDKVRGIATRIRSHAAMLVRDANRLSAAYTEINRALAAAELAASDARTAAGRQRFKVNA